ncbi:MAG: bifunctional precorrin-2 dehydrogenase/sirohydrochlorin ferrochelatase [Candidatus Omnitrophica bacterium]|nr:bifunctional precorrin-2 dehydrogenase/sirohydrochlorin ferrochelatase [Candidatus Omnitrophota bacterium]
MTKMTDYMPICLKVRNEECLVVGGGNVALRKITVLMKFGAKVICLSPEFLRQIEQLGKSGRIKCVKGCYSPKISLKKYTLVIAATDDAKVNKRIAADAARVKTLVNVVDQSAPGTVIMPAILKRPGLVVGVSTSGRSPSRAKKVRDLLSNAL